MSASITMYTQTTATEPYLDLMNAAMGQILATEDYHDFLSWMQQPGRLGQVFPVEEAELEQALAAIFARMIWNVTPLPGNRFRPRPLPSPGRNDPCICGSGRKYKQCCAKLPPLPEPHPEEIWELLVSHLSPAQLEQAHAARAIPPALLDELATHYQDEGRSGKAAALLEPLFAAGLDKLDGRYAAALHTLCDAYGDMGHTRKKQALLDRVIQHGHKELKSAAWQRLASMHADAGDPGSAWQAFREAQRADPDAPALSMLEITLLLSEDRIAEVGERARFWRKRLADKDYAPPDILAFLDEIAADPEGALLTQPGDTPLRTLLACMEGMDSRPLPAYTLVQDTLEGPFEADEDLQGELFQEADDNEEEAPWLIQPPAKLAALEERWQACYPIDKPFSVNPEPFSDIDPWAAEIAAEWQAFLEREPAAFDSLDILDDLATAVYIHSDFWLPGVAQQAYVPLLERAVAILDQALAAAAPGIELHWICPENRPALRLLARYAFWLEAEGEGEAARERLTQLIRLNPDDNHGTRTLLVNMLLRAGDDAAALELCSRYPGDMHVELALGAVLAHYRRGEHEQARQALCEAHALNSHVVPMLTAKRVRKPKLDERGITLGGKDQAWIYREAMRDCWRSVPGALDWLQRQSMEIGA